MESNLHDHYLALIERWQNEAADYKKYLFRAWEANRQQQRGMLHQSRKIKRLNHELQEAREMIRLLRCCSSKTPTKA